MVVKTCDLQGQHTRKLAHRMEGGLGSPRVYKVLYASVGVWAQGSRKGQWPRGSTIFRLDTVISYLNPRLPFTYLSRIKDPRLQELQKLRRVVLPAWVGPGSSNGLPCNCAPEQHRSGLS